MSNITTTDLADFGARERHMLVELLTAWNNQGLPNGFDASEVRPMMNTQSGYVFLTNADFDVAMMNGHTLERWYTCPECGNEGFAEDIEDGQDCCTSYMSLG